MSVLKPNLPLTVPIETWEAVAEAVRPTFADSYLSGASQTGSRLTPHTTIAYDRLRKDKAALAALLRLKIMLIRPLKFGHPDRPNGFAERQKWEAMMKQSYPF